MTVRLPSTGESQTSSEIGSENLAASQRVQQIMTDSWDENWLRVSDFEAITARFLEIAENCQENGGSFVSEVYDFLKEGVFKIRFLRLFWPQIKENILQFANLFGVDGPHQFEAVPYYDLVVDLGEVDLTSTEPLRLEAVDYFLVDEHNANGPKRVEIIEIMAPHGASFCEFAGIDPENANGSFQILVSREHFSETTAEEAIKTDRGSSLSTRSFNPIHTISSEWVTLRNTQAFADPNESSTFRTVGDIGLFASAGLEVGIAATPLGVRLQAARGGQGRRGGGGTPRNVATNPRNPAHTRRLGPSLRNDLPARTNRPDGLNQQAGLESLVSGLASWQVRSSALPQSSAFSPISGSSVFQPVTLARPSFGLRTTENTPELFYCPQTLEEMFPLIDPLEELGNLFYGEPTDGLTFNYLPPQEGNHSGVREPDLVNTTYEAAAQTKNQAQQSIIDFYRQLRALLERLNPDVTPPPDLFFFTHLEISPANQQGEVTPNIVDIRAVVRDTDEVSMFAPYLGQTRSNPTQANQANLAFYDTDVEQLLTTTGDFLSVFESVIDWQTAHELPPQTELIRIYTRMMRLHLVALHRVNSALELIRLQEDYPELDLSRTLQPIAYYLRAQRRHLNGAFLITVNDNPEVFNFADLVALMSGRIDHIVEQDLEGYREFYRRAINRHLENPETSTERRLALQIRLQEAEAYTFEGFE